MKLVFRCLPLLLLAALVAAPAAHAKTKLEIGLQDDGVFLQHHYPDPAGDPYTQAKQLHATWIRANVLWTHTLAPGLSARRTAPRSVAYDWSELDAFVNSARARGVKVQLTLTGPAPAWATKNHRAGVYKPSARAYGTWVRAVAKHFRGRVKRYSIWNEPNLISWLQPLYRVATLYRGLYRSGYAAITRVDRHAQILFGETVPYSLKRRSLSPLKFARQVLCVNAKYTKRSRTCPRLRTDGFATHPYDALHKPTYRYPGADNVTIATLGRLTHALDRFSALGALRPRGRGRLPMYLTEFSYVIYKNHKKVLSESRRAKYLVQGFETARRNPRVAELVQFQLVQPPAGSPWDYWQSYLITRAGTHAPAWTSLKTWADRAAKRKAIATR